MDKKEFSMFVMALKTFYPRENLLPNNQAMELWYRQLNDIPYQISEAALNKWVATNKWSPSIAEIREIATSIKLGDVPDWGEGWNKVQSAIRRFGMYRVDEAMNSFDPLTRECVERLGFKNICISENPATERANFRMVYEQLAQRKQVDAQVPDKLKELIGSIQNQQLQIVEKAGE